MPYKFKEIGRRIYGRTWNQKSRGKWKVSR